MQKHSSIGIAWQVDEIISQFYIVFCPSPLRVNWSGNHPGTSVSTFEAFTWSLNFKCWLAVNLYFKLAIPVQAWKKKFSQKFKIKDFMFMLSAMSYNITFPIFLMTPVYTVDTRDPMCVRDMCVSLSWKFK